MDPYSTDNDSGLCPDWIYSDSSNVHVAKDKAWFTTYHNFHSHLSSVYRIGAPIPAVGIGSVKLTVKARPDAFTAYGTSTIEIHNVLHVPSYICNVLGRPLASVYQIDLGGSHDNGGPPSRGRLSVSGQEIAHFQVDPARPFSLAVLPPEGMHFGPSPFKNGASYTASCHWPNEERACWQARHAQTLLEHAPPLYNPPYTWLELEYVNKCWGSEFRFLTQCRLKLHEERDRSEGRRIVRALMKGKEPAENEEKYIEVEGDLSDCLRLDRDRGVVRSKDLSAPRAPFF
ncbi:signal sequence receptor alpha subunit [Stagonosporopsis vannaccii]|nr:signal sequence receptor alpha subunit [Stagonosporopsis vannaccii]